MQSNVFENLIEITLEKRTDFKRVREFLTRIGVPSKDGTRLYQSCHIFHKQGKYYLVHFKEMFMIDGKHTNFDETDLARRNTIVNILLNMGYFKLVNQQTKLQPSLPSYMVKILSMREKSSWQLIAKYTIGSPRNRYGGDIHPEASSETFSDSQIESHDYVDVPVHV